MKRDSESALSSWLVEPGRKPLVVRGARQVGKSTLVRRVAEQAGLKLWEVNLEQHAGLNAAFQTLAPDTILREVGLRLNQVGVGQGRGMLFLDEIQATPAALTSLRYFFEQRPDLPVVAAGSLLEFALGAAGISMPVGRVQYHFLGPLTFDEFLGALGEDLVRDVWGGQSASATFSPSAHDRLLDLLREYLLVGGMPEAVARYADQRDPVLATRVHRSILATYGDDFSKYARGVDIERIRRVFDVLPTQLAQKVRYNRFHPDWRAADIRRCLELLLRAGVATAVVHSDGDGVPLGGQEDPSVYKLFHLDVGLVATASGMGHIPIEEFRTGRFVNEGVLAEQFVAQQLLWTQNSEEKPKLHYWQRGGARRNAEVDFLIALGSQVVPIEVKSGASGSLRSLHQFMLKHPGACAVRFDLNPPSRQDVDIAVVGERGMATARYQLTSLPLYLAGLKHLAGLLGPA
jgi:predicted AAA+ superfamily ATPase